MKKRLIFSSIVASLILGGCNSNNLTDNASSAVDNEPINDSKVISGKVIDGYIKGADVFLDLNGNGKFDTDEPYGKSDENGSYKLIGNFDLNDSLTIVAKGGIDVDTNKSFDGILKAPATEPNITPATTLVKELMDKNISKEEAMQEVAKILDINKSEISKDPIVEFEKNNTKLYKANLALHKTFELIAVDSDKNVTDVYKKVAETIHKSKKSGDDIKDLDRVIEKIDDINETIKEKAKALHYDIKNRKFIIEDRRKIAKEIENKIPHKKDIFKLPFDGKNKSTNEFDLNKNSNQSLGFDKFKKDENRDNKTNFDKSDNNKTKDHIKDMLDISKNFSKSDDIKEDSNITKNKEMDKFSKKDLNNTKFKDKNIVNNKEELTEEKDKNITKQIKSNYNKQAHNIDREIKDNNKIDINSTIPKIMDKDNQEVQEVNNTKPQTHEINETKPKEIPEDNEIQSKNQNSSELSVNKNNQNNVESNNTINLNR